MGSSALRRAIEGLLLTAAFLNASGILISDLDRGTTYTFRNINDGQSACLICTQSGQRKTCNKLVHTIGSPSIEFQCTRPEDVIQVEIQRTIDCTTQSCNGDIIAVEPISLRGFDRTFVWNLKAAAPKAFLIDFTRTGLTQINSSQACPDKHTITLRAVGNVDIGRYCRTGPIRQAQVLNQGTFSLHVPAGQRLQAGRFNVSVGQEIKSLAKIQVTLPSGSSPQVELLSPNYPQSFPDDDLIQWEFEVPAKHSATVQVVDHTQPACRKKGTALEYHCSARGALVLRLTDPQPAKELKNFTMTLRNCEMDRTRGHPRGLSLRFRVTSVGNSPRVLCTVDLRKMKGVSLNLEKTRTGSECQMVVDSKAKETILVQAQSVAKLYFQDCSPEDIRVRASGVIECRQLKDCSNTAVPLLVPTLPSCLPAPLSSVTWSLVPLPQGSVELRSPRDGLNQSLPGGSCNGSLAVSVSEDDGGRTPIGQFCSRGPFRSIQLRTNMTVTVSGDQGGLAGLRQSAAQPLLSAHFIKERISETYIFTLSPKGSAPALLASPGWPAGMKSSSTVSWIVSVPDKREARLVFANVSQPKCSDRHTNIRVQLLGSAEEMYSRREEEEAETQIDAAGSFYLNLSTCVLEKGKFSVLTKMTLHKSTNLLLTIILSVVSALLVLSAVVLAVVCVVIRKKKKALRRDQVSVYNPAGTVFIPGGGNPPHPDEDEYHVYESIEDTLVYTHLLKKELAMEEDDAVDTYQPLTGPTDPHRPPSSIHPEVGTYRPFPGTPNIGPPVPQANRTPSRDESMVHNDLYDPDGKSDAGNAEEPASGGPALGARMEPEGSD